MGFLSALIQKKINTKYLKLRQIKEVKDAN